MKKTAKSSRVIEAFLLFPKKLRKKDSFGIIDGEFERRWLKKAKILQEYRYNDEELYGGRWYWKNIRWMD